MRRTNKVKILVEAVVIGALGVGGFIATVLATSSPGHLHIWTTASVIFVVVVIFGIVLWISDVRPSRSARADLPS
jgi:hypothetical protein